LIDAQGVGFEAVAQSVQDKPGKCKRPLQVGMSNTFRSFSLTIHRLVKTIDPEVLSKLKTMEQQAVDLAEKEDTEGALKILNQCIELEKDYASAYNNR
jgi:hypothetical protein